MRKRVSLQTLGCRLNIAESGYIAQGFVDRGYEIVPFGEEAEVTFINTCTVTDKADLTSRNIIRKARKSSPKGKVIVAGCFAQVDSKEIMDMGHADVILGSSKKHNVFDYLDKKMVVNIERDREFNPAMTTECDNHTRAFLKIQDGCNYVCSYCIIPKARGASRSIKVEDGVRQAQELVKSGYREIVLTGVNVGEFESTRNERLSDLVNEILKIEGVERVRLSSIELNTVTDELIQVMKHPKFMNHFHIPLQSGEDEILGLMRRKYTTALFREVILKLQREFPDATFGTDIIVGFPGESEEHFQKTSEFLKELPITHFHVFPFSKREGTVAASMSDVVSKEIKRSRVNGLIGMGNRKMSDRMESMVGERCEVLFERRDAKGRFSGFTSNYLRVKVNTELELNNQIRSVKIVSFTNGELMGELLN